MSNEEILAKHMEMLQQESSNREGVWFVSQVVPGKPETARACYVIARGPAEANQLVHTFKLYIEGSESFIQEVDYVPDDDDFFKLLTREQVMEAEKRAFAKIRKIYVANVD